eukprot:scaffold63984_cov57-Attheya_sp.AAC.1
MAVNENDTETVQRLLAEETCRVDGVLDGVLDKALIRDKTEVADILQNDPRVKSLTKKVMPCVKLQMKGSPSNTARIARETGFALYVKNISVYIVKMNMTFIGNTIPAPHAEKRHVILTMIWKAIFSPVFESARTMMNYVKISNATIARRRIAIYAGKMVKVVVLRAKKRACGIAGITLFVESENLIHSKGQVIGIGALMIEGTCSALTAIQQNLVLPEIP